MSVDGHGVMDHLSGPGLVALSVLMLAVGPLIFRFTNRSKRALAFLDGFILTSIAGLLLAHVLPEALRAAGPMAFGALAFGALLPILFERLGKNTRSRANTVLWLFALGGFAVHTLLDGVALVQSTDEHHDHALAFAVILHRLPVGLALWWLIKPRYGRGWATAFLAVEASVTVVGYWLGPEVLLHLEESALALLQATVAGSLLHVLTHHSPEETSNAHAASVAQTTPALASHVRLTGVTFKPALAAAALKHGQPLIAPTIEASSCGHYHAPGTSCGHAHTKRSAHPGLETLGAALGVALVAALPYLEPHDHDHSHHAMEGWLERFIHLSLETAPALLLGYALAGLATEFLPRISARWMARAGSGPLEQAARGVAFGAPLPLCSCGVVPLYQALVRQGVPATAAMAFLVATPELGVESILLSLPLLGVELTAARLIAALAVALLVGWGLGRTIAPLAPNIKDEQRGSRSLTERLRAAASFGFKDVVDDSMAWIIVGLLAASMLATNALPPWLNELPSGVGVLAFAILGMPLYVCASGATPLAAALIFAGASPGAALAFLIAGPATNVTTLGMLRQVHGPGVGLRFGAMVVGLAFVAGITTDLVLGRVEVIPTHAHGNEGASWLHWASLGALALVFSGALWRSGPRAMMRTLMESDAHQH